jgi:hypothetical protein
VDKESIRLFGGGRKKLLADNILAEIFKLFQAKREEGQSISQAILIEIIAKVLKNHNEIILNHDK